MSGPSALTSCLSGSGNRESTALPLLHWLELHGLRPARQMPACLRILERVNARSCRSFSPSDSCPLPSYGRAPPRRERPAPGGLTPTCAARESLRPQPHLLLRRRRSSGASSLRRLLLLPRPVGFNACVAHCRCRRRGEAESERQACACFCFFSDGSIGNHRLNDV